VTIEEVLSDDQRVVLGFDGSSHRDATAMFVVGPDGHPLMVGSVLEPWQVEVVERSITNVASKVEFVARRLTLAMQRIPDRAVQRIYWLLAVSEFRAHGLTRPNGRPRRSGHRHRGTPAWRRRHG
jgi:hypothetical protein